MVLLPFALDLGPRVAKPHAAVEHQLRRRGVALVDAEVALTLELEAGAAVGTRERRLQARAAPDLERARAERGVPVVGVVGPGRAEEMVVEPHLGRDRSGRRHAVDGPLLAPPPVVAASG